MRIHSIVALAVSAFLLLPASKASADRIEVVSVTSNMGGKAHTLENTVNGTGLSAPTLTATHEGTTPGNSWVSTPSSLMGYVEFDLGGSFWLTGISFWNQNGGGPGAAGITGIQGVNVFVSMDGVFFVPLPGAPSTFAQVVSSGPVGPEMFSFPPVAAAYVRFYILGNYGDAIQTGFAEVAFDGTSGTVRRTALYDAVLKAPRCAAAGGSCDSGTLLVGRDSMQGGAEPNQPNTINNSCADGTFGAFHSEESIDRVRIYTVDGGLFTTGKTVRILTTVWSWNGDLLDLFYASEASNPSWTYLTTITPPASAKLQTVSATYVLPAGGTQAVRAVFRFGGVPSECTAGDWDDHDDLIFHVGDVRGDFDGDAKADPTVFRPSTGRWYSLNSRTHGLTSTSVSWGISTDVPVPGDYDGDGVTDPAFFRPSLGVWAVLKSSTNYTTSIVVLWGLSTDVPVPGDYDGDGRTDPAVYRPSAGKWFILQSSTNYATSTAVAWGQSTDLPVAADYDGDGKADPAIFRPSTGLWGVLKSSTNYTTLITVLWGQSTDVAVPGDYDGDGKADLAFFRPSSGLWAVLKSSTNYTTLIAVLWGLSTDVAVPADYDGDGKTDPAIFRPSTGLWALLKSSTNYATSSTVSWGGGTDVPMNKRP